MRQSESTTRGRFITLEGIEGVGKTTTLPFIADRLKARGVDVLVTREPGGVPVAERIRAVLLTEAGPPIPPLTELLLIFAARAAHLNDLVWPALDRGQWVVCDRFTDASYAYQGGGRRIDKAVIEELERTVQGNFRPDLTLLLDADWNATCRRRQVRNAGDRFEQEGREFFERVRATYLARAGREPERFRVIDATRDLAAVQADIATALVSVC